MPAEGDRYKISAARKLFIAMMNQAIAAGPPQGLYKICSPPLRRCWRG
jgi:hypothetical protein